MSKGWPKKYVMEFEFLKELIGDAYGVSDNLIEGEHSLEPCNGPLEGYDEMDEGHKEHLRDVYQKLGELLTRTTVELHRLWAIGKEAEESQTNNQ